MMRMRLESTLGTGRGVWKGGKIGLRRGCGKPPGAALPCPHEPTSESWSTAALAAYPLAVFPAKAGIKTAPCPTTAALIEPGPESYGAPSGLVERVDRIPRALPWATSCRPFGAELHQPGRPKPGP